MNINYNEMKTVKEWAELAGIQLVTYGGFMKMYDELSKNYPSSDGPITRAVKRSEEPGDLLCNRAAFERGLDGCQMVYIENEQLVRMADIIPIYAEKEISIRLDYKREKVKSSLDNKKKTLKEDIEELLKCAICKALIMSKSINFNEKKPLSNFEGSKYLSKEDKLIITEFNSMNNFNGTVEDLEVYLIENSIKEIEEILKTNNTEKLNDTLDKVGILLVTTLYSERFKKNKDISFSYVSFDEEEKNRRM